MRLVKFRMRCECQADEAGATQKAGLHTCATQPLIAYDFPEVLESTSWMVPVKPLYLR